MNIEQLIEEHLKSVYNFVYRIVNDKDETEDIVQEVFVKVWKKITPPSPSYNKKGSQNLKSWIFTIARNTTIDYFRKRKNVNFSQMDSQTDSDEKSFEENITDIEPLPDDIFMKKELGNELEKVLTKIRPDFREIILLHYTEDLTFAEIAEITGKHLNTIKSHHLRALSALRKLLI